MDRMSARYQSQVETYRKFHFGSDPGAIQKLLYSCRALFNSLKQVSPTPQFQSESSYSLKKAVKTLPLSERKPKNVKSKRLISLLLRKPAEPTIVVADDFKEAAKNNNYSQYSDSVFIDGDLCLAGLDIKRLPEYFYVNGDLNLSGCVNLKELPKKKIRVVGELVADNCSSLSKITRDLKVGKDLSFRNCTALSKLPQSVRDIGYRSDSTTREIDLTRTKINPKILQSGKKVNFNVSALFDDLICKWYSYTGLKVPLPEINIGTMTSTQYLDFGEWLSLLFETADFKNGTSSFRINYAKRVIEILTMMTKDEEAKNISLALINKSLTTCNDGAALRLDDIEKQFLNKRAEALVCQEDTEIKLWNLAHQIMHLETLEDYVVSSYLKSKNRYQFAGTDEIEIMLAFKTRLRTRLNLPIRVGSMSHEVFSCVNEDDLNAAYEHVSRKCTPPAAVALFLENWEPWQMLMKKKAVPDYDKLDECDAPNATDQSCEISLHTTSKMVSLAGHSFDYDTLKEWYFKGGSDPDTSEKIDWKQVKRFKTTLTRSE